MHYPSLTPLSLNGVATGTGNLGREGSNLRPENGRSSDKRENELKNLFREKTGFLGFITTLIRQGCTDRGLEHCRSLLRQCLYVSIYIHAAPFLLA